MKVSVFTLTSLFLSVTVARPHIKHVGEPLPEKYRMTSFSISEDGTQKVQCWELDSQLNTFQVQRSDGTRATASSLSLADANLDSVDILTLPPRSSIWSLSGLSPAVWSAGAESGNGYKVVAVKKGLVQVKPAAGSRDARHFWDDSQHTFSLENGDDWFYFEDKYTDSDSARGTSCMDNPTPSLELGTISNRNAELLVFGFTKPPSHKVLHDGPCNVNGVTTA